jgi:hypothetical protein
MAVFAAEPATAVVSLAAQADAATARPASARASRGCRRHGRGASEHGTACRRRQTPLGQRPALMATAMPATISNAPTTVHESLAVLRPAAHCD